MKVVGIDVVVVVVGVVVVDVVVVVTVEKHNVVAKGAFDGIFLEAHGVEKFVCNLLAHGHSIGISELAQLLYYLRSHLFWFTHDLSVKCKFEVFAHNNIHLLFGGQ